MRKKAHRRSSGNVERPAERRALLGGLSQVLVPMVAGMMATKQELRGWVLEVGLNALREVFEADAEGVAGPKGKHLPERTHFRWGEAPAEFPFGGRRITVERPRVRSRAGREVHLPRVEAFRREDPMPERVVEQVLLGVSTRGYEGSLEATPPEVKSRGTKKSSASRHLVAKTTEKLKALLARRLEGVDLIGLLLDGLKVAGQTVVVALGVTREGRKVPLGLWLGSTENATVCTALLQDLLERGLTISERILCVIDGGKGLRKALEDVLGDLAVVQRCQVHKRRNVRDHLKESHQAYVRRAMNEAYASASAQEARRELKELVGWLERNGEPGAAASRKEGLEETLTVVKLGLPETLRKFFATTNAIENLMGTIRKVTRNVKRWRGGGMVLRWTGLGVLEAEGHFRRIKGHRDLPILSRAVRARSSSVDETERAA